LENANKLRRLWTLYKQNQDLIQVGAYESGSNSDLDLAITLRKEVEDLLQQNSSEEFSIDTCKGLLEEVLGDDYV
jgi:flagellum-specific ATP synthase